MVQLCMNNNNNNKDHPPAGAAGASFSPSSWTPPQTCPTRRRRRRRRRRPFLNRSGARTLTLLPSLTRRWPCSCRSLLIAPFCAPLLLLQAVLARTAAAGLTGAGDG